MPEQRLQRTRATLPSGYQFGDATLPLSVLNYIAERTECCGPKVKAYYREMILSALFRGSHRDIEGHPV